jgi:hypothetical protein
VVSFSIVARTRTGTSSYGKSPIIAEERGVYCFSNSKRRLQSRLHPGTKSSPMQTLKDRINERVRPRFRSVAENMGKRKNSIE